MEEVRHEFNLRHVVLRVRASDGVTNNEQELCPMDSGSIASLAVSGFGIDFDTPFERESALRANSFMHANLHT